MISEQPGSSHDSAGGDCGQDASVSAAEALVALATSAGELAEMTSHLRQLTASLAHELQDRRTARRPSPPITAGQLSGVFLAEEGLADELVRHSGTWRRLSRQVWRLTVQVRPHLRQKLLRRQTAGGHSIVGLIRALEVAVAVLIALTACREYAETDVAHLEKLLRVVSAIHAAKGVVLSVTRRAPLLALPGLRLHHHTVTLHQVGPPPSLHWLCQQLARARSGRLAAALQWRLSNSADLSVVLRRRREASPPPDAASPALRLPPIPTIRVEWSTPTSGYASSGGEPASPVRSAALEDLLVREENAAHSLLLAVPTAGRRLVTDDQLRPANPDTGKQERLSGNCRRRLLRLYRTAVWGAACQLASDGLLWRSAAGLPPLSAAAAPDVLHWLQMALRRCSDGLRELGVCGAGLAARLRLCLVPTVASYLLAPALRHSQSTRHTTVQLPAAEQGTHCGRLYFEAVSLLVEQLNMVLSDQSAAMVGGDVEGDLLPLLRLQLLLQQMLRTAMHQLSMWVTSRGPPLLNQWQTTTYFLLTMTDLPRCARLMHSLLPSPPLDAVTSGSPELEELSTERAESNRRLDSAALALQGSRSANLSAVSAACRGSALQSLGRLFPGPQYWRRHNITTSQPSDYVRPFIGGVLDEVLTAASRLDASLQQTISALVVKVACAAWMEHILQSKLRFSYAGARQLGRDAAALRDWLRQQPPLSPEVRQHLLSLDELRELEGAARLLQRQPRQPRHNQVSPSAPATTAAAAPAGRQQIEEIPAELFVRRRDAWLRMRLQREDSPAALARRWLVCRCCMWPN